MGAGVAASPHCPFASTLAWEARASCQGRFRETIGQNRGFRHRSLRGPSEACAPSGFPAGSPSGPKPWRFAARQIRNSRPCSRSRPIPKAEASVSSGGGILGRSLGSAWQIHGPKSWVSAGSQLPGRSPVLPDCDWPGQSPPVAARRSKPRFCRTVHELSPVAASVSEPKLGNLVGASRNLPLSHPLKGKPAASAWRRLRQPPCLRFRPRVWWDKGLVAPAVAGKAFLRCRKIVLATG